MPAAIPDALWGRLGQRPERCGAWDAVHTRRRWLAAGALDRLFAGPAGPPGPGLAGDVVPAPAHPPRGWAP